MEDKERRAHPRKLVSTAVAFHDADGARLHGWLHDIGRGGCFIASPSHFTFGEELDFELRITDARTLVSGKGRVAWVRETNDRHLPAGMGIRFVEVSEGALAAIDRLGNEGARLSRPNTMIGIAPPPATSSPSYSPDVKLALDAPPDPIDRAPAPPTETPAPPQRKKRGRWLIAAGGLASVVVAAVIASFVFRSSKTSAPDAAVPTASVEDPAPIVVAIVDASPDVFVDAAARDASSDGGRRAKPNVRTKPKRR